MQSNVAIGSDDGSGSSSINLTVIRRGRKQSGTQIPKRTGTLLEQVAAQEVQTEQINRLAQRVIQEHDDWKEKDRVLRTGPEEDEILEKALGCLETLRTLITGKTKQDLANSSIGDVMREIFAPNATAKSASKAQNPSDSTVFDEAGRIEMARKIEELEATLARARSDSAASKEQSRKSYNVLALNLGNRDYEYEQLRQELTSTQRASAFADKRVAELEKMCTTFKAEINSWKNSYSSGRTALVRIREERKVLQDDTAALRDRVLELQREVTIFQTMRDSQKQQFDILQTRTAELEQSSKIRENEWKCLVDSTEQQAAESKKIAADKHEALSEICKEQSAKLAELRLQMEEIVDLSTKQKEDHAQELKTMKRNTILVAESEIHSIRLFQEQDRSLLSRSRTVFKVHKDRLDSRCQQLVLLLQRRDKELAMIRVKCGELTDVREHLEQAVILLKVDAANSLTEKSLLQEGFETARQKLLEDHTKQLQAKDCEIDAQRGLGLELKQQVSDLTLFVQELYTGGDCSGTLARYGIRLKTSEIQLLGASTPRINFSECTIFGNCFSKILPPLQIRRSVVRFLWFLHHESLRNCAKEFGILLDIWRTWEEPLSMSLSEKRDIMYMLYDFIRHILKHAETHAVWDLLQWLAIQILAAMIDYGLSLGEIEEIEENFPRADPVTMSPIVQMGYVHLRERLRLKATSTHSSPALQIAIPRLACVDGTQQLICLRSPKEGEWLVSYTLLGANVHIAARKRVGRDPSSLYHDLALKYGIFSARGASWLTIDDGFDFWQILHHEGDPFLDWIQSRWANKPKKFDTWIQKQKTSL